MRDGRSLFILLLAAATLVAAGCSTSSGGSKGKGDAVAATDNGGGGTSTDGGATSTDGGGTSTDGGGTAEDASTPPADTGGGIEDTGGSPPTDTPVVADAGGGGPIPDPGTNVNGEWTDVEPNDDPAHAVPVGTLAGPIWMGFADPLTAIGTNSDVDFYVFKTGEAASLTEVYIGICWEVAVNLLDIYLYEVKDDKQGDLIASSAAADPSCETVVGWGEGPTKLAENTVYLLEVRAGPDLDASMKPALYSA